MAVQNFTFEVGILRETGRLAFVGYFSRAAEKQGDIDDPMSRIFSI